MPKQKPFTHEMMATYADRLVRHSLLSRQLRSDPGEDPHPCLEVSSSLLESAEVPLKASAAYSRRSPAWSMVRTWFSSRVLELARERLMYYGFPPSMSSSIIYDLESRGFDHLLERAPGESGVRPSLGSNVMSPGQWKMS
jgi:hypothetical protein